MVNFLFIYFKFIIYIFSLEPENGFEKTNKLELKHEFNEKFERTLLLTEDIDKIIIIYKNMKKYKENKQKKMINENQTPKINNTNC